MTAKSEREVAPVLRAVLFDLDGTLLDIDLDTFLPAYLEAVASRVREHLPPDRLVRDLLASTDVMVADRDPARTNRQVFNEDFFARIGLPEALLGPVFDDFYRNHFPRLAIHARPFAAARRVVEAVQRAGLATAVATNPVFPLVAIEERLRWADVADLPFNLITSYEAMHYCKPHPEYFLEVAGILGCRPEECLMAGDDVAMDLEGARAAGMRTFHVVRSRRADWAAEGTLDELLPAVREAGGSAPARSESQDED